ncbi:MAG: glutamine amidotransferase [Bifidobacteriaceae bacterium]|jgi:CobQ-like glutamine amidotransferase family enzyme|nr:glutamine amidotransferase [Bifidobacteriaceae bacterium]
MTVLSGTSDGGSNGGAVTIVHLYPTLMGTYGDGGNIRILVRRLAARRMNAHLITVGPGEPVPDSADLYVLGGGEDRSQVAASRELRNSGALNRAAARGATVFAVCAGLQVLGHDFEVSGGETEPGLGLLDATTRRRSRHAQGGAPPANARNRKDSVWPRAVGEVLAEPLDGSPLLTGYENHGGGTVLGPAAAPLARVISGIGNGSGSAAGDGHEGAVQGRILATYLHGPVLARNPALADRLLELATGSELAPLEVAYVDQLRAEREHYVKTGKLSAESVHTRR